jgi:hypothetical protein
MINLSSWNFSTPKPIHITLQKDEEIPLVLDLLTLKYLNFDEKYLKNDSITLDFQFMGGCTNENFPINIGRINHILTKKYMNFKVNIKSSWHKYLAI